MMGDLAPQETSDLITRFKAGETAAFETVYRAYVPMLANVAVSLTHSRDTAEDAVQEIFLRLWQVRDKLAVNTFDDLRFYLLRMLRNHLISEQRHEQIVNREERGAVKTGRVLAMGDAFLRADDALIAAELDRALAQATAEMAPRMRLALVLRLRHQMTNAEIARVLEISDVAAAKLLSRARGILRSVWERHQR